MKLKEDKEEGCGYGWFKLPRWLVGENRYSVCKHHDKLHESGSNAQKVVDADRQAEQFAVQMWEVQGRKHTLLGDFMSGVVWLTRKIFWRR